MRSVFGVIAPHPPIMVSGVGGSRAGVTEDSLTALSLARDALAVFAPEVIVVMSPHAPGFADAFAVDDSPEFAGDLSQFGDRVAYGWPGDPEMARAILDGLADEGIAAVARAESARLEPGVLDHGTIVPLSFLEPTQRVPLVILSLSLLPYDMHRALGSIVFQAAEKLGRRIAFVASGDLSHRLTPDAPAGYSPRAQALDDAIVEAIRAGRFDELSEIDPELIEAGGECGLRSFITLGGFTGDDSTPTRVLSYEGPWGVGYLCAMVGDAAVTALDAVPVHGSSGRKGGMAGSDDSAIVVLARQAIEGYVRHREVLAQPELSADDYPSRAGTFVSLHRGGELRGCIGTILPTRETLAHEVVGNAIEAATRDPRFPPVGVDELDDLEIKVDVLQEPESCSIEDLDPAVYGVITSSGWRRGLLLPALDGVDDVQTQVRIAMSKGGIQLGEACSFERFRVDRYT